MKLAIDYNSIQEGVFERRFGAKRQTEIQDIFVKKQPVIVNPFQRQPDGEIVTAAFLKTMQVVDKRVTLTVVPIVGRFFVVCEAKSSLPKAVIVRLNGKSEQFQFDRAGKTVSKFSFVGPGVDPELVDESKTGFAELLQKHSAEPCVRHAINWIREQLIKEP